MSDAEIEGVKEGPGASVWNEEDRLLLTAIDQTCSGGRIGDATWNALCATMDRCKIMDLVQAVGYFTMIAWGLIAMEVQLEPDFAESPKNRAKSD